MTRQELSERTATFAANVQKAVEPLCRDYACREHALQLIAAATSTAANYRASGKARSRREFLAKLGVAVEEADESVFWLEHLDAARTGRLPDSLLDEARQLARILSASRRTAQRNYEALDRGGRTARRR